MRASESYDSTCIERPGWSVGHRLEGSDALIPNPRPALVAGKRINLPGNKHRSGHGACCLSG